MQLMQEIEGQSLQRHCQVAKYTKVTTQLEYNPNYYRMVFYINSENPYRRDVRDCKDKEFFKRIIGGQKEVTENHVAESYF